MPYVEELRRQLLVAAEAGGEDTRVTAERLAAALEPSARLALMDALSAAADEITRDLAPGSVEVRLRGGRTDFIVTPPPADEPFDAEEDEPVASLGRQGDVSLLRGDGEEGGTSRITLRLPDRLKPLVEEAAKAEGLSVNAWLVRAVATSLEPGGSRGTRRAGRQMGRGYTGWAR
ncbi:hypothetical protein H4W79_002444 [Nocardiopsis terrae]|uniref:HicB family protein n=2 Tax=Nocardiopsis terrae TaxID=372655 RepID=A0ABR9HGS7_9ACTN|nr:histidine kinase [Nocardiopsis terrae]MBE1458230.1 hypothetical protein [Nocardiopsis terrae]